MALIQWAGLIIIIGCVIVLFWFSWKLQLRWWQSLVLRLLLVLAIGLAVDSWIKSDQPLEWTPEILVLDRSDSISEESLIQSQIFATAWKGLRPNRQVLVFGDSSEHVLSEIWPEVDVEGSDLVKALEATKTGLDGQPARVILASDGLVENPFLIEDWLSGFSEAGGEVDVLPLDRVNYPADVSVGPIKGSKSVWSEMAFPFLLPVYAESQVDAVLQVYVNDTLYKESSIRLNKGETTLQIMLQSGNPGVMNVEVRLVLQEDQFQGNNAAFASFRVHAQPKILLITKAVQETESLIIGLEEANSQVFVTTPDQFPTSMDALNQYQVIMIHDILAQDLNYEQMQAIRLHVVTLGKGLVFIGGRNSYTLGGYQTTILEPIMPIILAPPERIQRVPITFLLVLDRSGSMAGDRDTDIAPIDLTREAAMRAIETLRSDDYLGVLTFSGSTSWDVELAKVGEGLALRNAQDKVSRIVALGGTFMYQALDEAINELVTTDTTDYPHILLMSDGESREASLDEFLRLVQVARSNGITISTIALGHESDPETLGRIAEVGGGRFYQVIDPQDLPRVMISESRAVQAENIQEGRTNLILGIDNHPILTGLNLNELPLLYAYVATQSKSARGAEDVLLSGNFGDPLLSVWQVGLGHVAAWMGDIGEQWNPDLKDWDDQGKFWQQVARFTLPDPSIGEPDVQISFEGREMTVELTLNDSDPTLRSQTPRWILLSKENTGQAYPMTQVKSGVYQVVLPTPEFGAYTGIIQYADRTGSEDLLVPFAVNYPEEWRFEDSAIGAERLALWAQKNNGMELSFELELENSSDLERSGEENLFDDIMIFLLIGWPLEIAVRRWKMPWRRA